MFAHGWSTWRPAAVGILADTKNRRRGMHVPARVRACVQKSKYVLPPFRINTYIFPLSPQSRGPKQNTRDCSQEISVLVIVMIIKYIIQYHSDLLSLLGTVQGFRHLVRYIVSSRHVACEQFAHGDGLTNSMLANRIALLLQGRLRPASVENNRLVVL